MYYCEKCNSLFDSKKCPVCGSNDLREPLPDDFCFLTECGHVYGKMLSDSLEKSNVKCVLLPSGNGVRSKLALPLENYKVFVPFKDYDAACDVFDDIFRIAQTDKLKEELISNIDNWFIAKQSTVKKIYKKTKTDSSEDVFDIIKTYVENAESIQDKGLISFSDNNYAHGLLVKSGGLVFWFSAETYEILF